MGELLEGLTTQSPPADAATGAGDPVRVECAHGSPPLGGRAYGLVWLHQVDSAARFHPAVVFTYT